MRLSSVCCLAESMSEMSLRAAREIAGRPVRLSVGSVFGGRPLVPTITAILDPESRGKPFHVIPPFGVSHCALASVAPCSVLSLLHDLEFFYWCRPPHLAYQVVSRKGRY